MGLWSPECDLRFLTAPARVSRSGTRLPRIFKDLAVPRSLVKLLKGLDMRKLARSRSTTELLPLKPQFYSTRVLADNSWEGHEFHTCRKRAFGKKASAAWACSLEADLRGLKPRSRWSSAARL